MENRTHSLEELSDLGVDFYLKELKDKLEKDHYGEYVVIDVDQKKYQIAPDRSDAIAKAQKEFGEKLFCMMRIGSVKKINRNFDIKRYAWHF